MKRCFNSIYPVEVELNKLKKLAKQDNVDKSILLEQIKEIVAPLLNEDYRESTYSDTLAALSEEVETLKREKAISEGKETLRDLLAPYTERTKRMVGALIEEGTSDEVTEKFYNLMENLPELFEAEEDDEEDKDDDQQEPGKDGEEDEGNDDEGADDEGDDDKKKKGKKGKKSDDDDEEGAGEENEGDDPSLKEESYINEGFEGDDASSKPADNTFKKMLKAYATK